MNTYIEVQKLSVQEYTDNWLYTIMQPKLKDKNFDVKEYIVQNTIYPHVGNIMIGIDLLDEL